MARRPTYERCARCNQAFGHRAAYQCQTARGLEPRCLRCALCHAPMLRRSGVIAFVVGTLLTVINQGDLLVAGRWAPALAWKVPLTYAVPFIVATLGALGAGKVPPAPALRRTDERATPPSGSSGVPPWSPD